MRAVGTILWALLLSVLASQPAFAERRIALVIGNSAYRSVPPLSNPENDAAAIAAIFRKANFDVVDVGNNLAVNEMRRTLRSFAVKAKDADIAVIYYAGHGLEVDGTNYLVPVDAQLESDADVYDEALPLDRVMVALEPAKQLRLLILDACRDNPFARTMKRTIASRAIGRGLAKVEPSNPNTLIAFAAKAGFTASDGDGKNSPFALALAQHLTTPGLDLRKAFGFVRDDVLKVTGNRQEPFIYGSLGGGDVALVPAPSAAQAPAADQNAAIRRDYELAAQVGTREAWDSFIATYPDGFYAKLAIAQRNKLQAEEARSAAAQKAQQAADQQARAAAEAELATRAQAEAQARAAEQARIAAEKIKAMEDTRIAEAKRAQAGPEAKAPKSDDDARVAAARTQADADAKAVREAKAVQETREAAEARRIADEAKAAEAERARATAQARAAEEEAKLAAARAKVQAVEEEAKLAEARARAEALQQAKAAEDARLSAETNAAVHPERIDTLAALTPPGQSQPTTSPAGDVTKLLQGELRRVGCNTGAVDGNWNEAARKSLTLFNRHAGTTLDVRLASVDALAVVKSKTARVCPLVCDHGYKAEGDVCVKIVCRPGYRVGDGNACEKIGNGKPVATREAPAPEPRREQAAPPPRQQSQSSGQVYCNRSGCQPVHQGCFITRGGSGPGHNGEQREVCP